MEPQHPPSYIVIVPTPGMGHLIPLIEFAKQILQITSFQIYFMIPTLGPPTQAQNSALTVLSDSRASYTFLPLVNLVDLPSDAKIETKMSATLVGSLPAIRSHLRDLQGSHHDLTALVVDLFGTDVLDVAPEFEMKRYLFFPSTGMCLSLFLHLPYLDAQVTCEYRDMRDNNIIELPGCTPVHGKDLLDPTQDRSNDAYKWLLYHTKRYNLAEGIILNSFNELEEGALTFLQKDEPGRPPVYPIGPLIQTGLGDEKTDGSECLKWLDEQPRGSVLFISFGSGGTLSHNQIIELAHGFEMSNQRFLWVLRTPNDKTLNATYFTIEGDPNNPLDYLPKGFLEKTKELGLVIPNWVPQVKVLSHASTCGFLTHCGWNSILESVTHGVPMIAWPLYAEQKMNAAMLTNGLKVALRPNADENGLVGRGDIAKVVKGLIEGEEGKEIQNRMNSLKDAAISAVGKYGSSSKALHQVLQMWKSH